MEYLGLLLGGRPSSKSFWMDLIQRIKNRLTPWKKKFLNQGGRLVLIKAILASITTYFMLVFKVPTWVAHKLERLQQNFFWGKGLDKEKIHTVKWDKLILNKNKGLLNKWV